MSAWLVAGLAGAGCAHRRAARYSELPAPAMVKPVAAVATPVPVIESPEKPAPVPAPEKDATVISDAPPPAQVEVVGAAPGPLYAWIPGRWEWQGTWTWSRGKWATMPEANMAWIPGRWVRRNDGWIWVDGYWRRAS